MEEFSSSGETLTTIQFGAAEARPGGGFLSALKPTLSYRTFKQPWIGCPNTKPDVVAESSVNGTTVYISWNGATEIDAWEIYGGNSTDSVNCLKIVPKTGFETSADIETVEFVQVKPKMRGLGQGVCAPVAHGASDIIEVSH